MARGELTRLYKSCGLELRDIGFVLYQAHDITMLDDSHKQDVLKPNVVTLEHSDLHEDHESEQYVFLQSQALRGYVLITINYVHFYFRTRVIVTEEDNRRILRKTDINLLTVRHQYSRVLVGSGTSI